MDHICGEETMKLISVSVDVEEVDSLTYGELASIHASASALNIDGPYIFLTFDDNLYVGEYDRDDLKFYHIVGALKNG